MKQLFSNKATSLTRLRWISLGIVTSLLLEVAGGLW